jgi:hypothetical protein
MAKFKIGDRILPRADGRFAAQRGIGIQTIVSSCIGIYDWTTNEDYNYKESDIELAVKPIEVYGIVKFLESINARV